MDILYLTAHGDCIQAFLNFCGEAAHWLFEANQSRKGFIHSWQPIREVTTGPRLMINDCVELLPGVYQALWQMTARILSALMSGAEALDSRRAAL